MVTSLPPTPGAAPMSPLSRVLVRTELRAGGQVWGQDTRDILGQGKVSGIRLRIAPVPRCHAEREQGGGEEKATFYLLGDDLKVFTLCDNISSMIVMNVLTLLKD